MSDVTTAPAPVAGPAPAPSVSALLEPAVAPPAVAPKTLSLPGKDAKPEDWAKFYDEVGAPKDASGYQLPVPEGDKGEFAKVAAGWMAEARLTPDQAKALAGKWNAHVAGMTTAQTEATKNAAEAAAKAKDYAARQDEAKLNSEWGKDAEKNKGYAARVAREFFKPIAGEKTADILTAIEDAIGYGATMKLMHSIGSKLGEADPRGLGEGQGGKPARETAYSEIQAAINKSTGRA